MTGNDAWSGGRNGCDHESRFYFYLHIVRHVYVFFFANIFSTVGLDVLVRRYISTDTWTRFNQKRDTLYSL